MKDHTSAFPCPGELPDGSTCTKTDYGMDLRDYFAAHAMDLTFKAFAIEGALSPTECLDVAINAYRLADAMMEARTRDE